MYSLTVALQRFGEAESNCHESGGVKWKRLSRESAKVRERRDAFLKETRQKPG